ncbi:MAG: hypothetical protein AMJ54_04660 [Deltaproteobacteria bacterium SG8_13]|nr:MAG: hypothetical protein AMJ54_04660 [Deltaproteobacteria bacterium SG8_13]
MDCLLFSEIPASIFLTGISETHGLAFDGLDTGTEKKFNPAMFFLKSNEDRRSARGGWRREGNT